MPFNLGSSLSRKASCYGLVSFKAIQKSWIYIFSCPRKIIIDVLVKTSGSASHFNSPKIFVQKWIYHLDLVRNMLGYIQDFWFGQILIFHILFGAKAVVKFLPI